MNSAPNRRESFHGSHKSFFLMMMDCMKASTTDDAYAETHRCVPFHGHTLAAAATVGIGVNTTQPASRITTTVMTQLKKEPLLELDGTRRTAQTPLLADVVGDTALSADNALHRGQGEHRGQCARRRQDRGQRSG
jgi:hypothetical protein